MCGIGGYYQTGSTENAPQWAKPALRKMWNSLQSRGTDASGVAYESPSGIRHVKTDKSAYELSSLGMNLAFGILTQVFGVLTARIYLSNKFSDAPDPQLSAFRYALEWWPYYFSVGVIILFGFIKLKYRKSITKLINQT